MGITKSELVSEIKPLLKNMRYKKRNTTWVKKSDDNISIMVNIQGSQYDKEDFYINLGVYINDLGTKEIPSISDCHLMERVRADVDSAQMMIKVVEKWEDWYGTCDRIRGKISEQKMPMMTQKNVYAYFLVKK
ncbi:MAG: DUF4304 domain-containing protein [Oscillospiraceae bacterium]|nr:DUF4304 domain-containing protein [Oscillospiraceae bacterium]